MRSLIFPLLLIVLVFAIPPEVEREALVAQATQAEVTRVVGYRLTIQQEILPGVPELVGRTYAVAASQKVSGFFVNGEGSWIGDSSLLDDTPLRQSAVERSRPSIIYDAARIEHVNKFSIEANPPEIRAYETYFDSRIGNLKEYYLSHPDAFTLEKVGEDLFMEAGDRQFPATLKANENGMLLLEIEGVSTPSLRFSDNQRIQLGDTVYVTGTSSLGSGTVPLESVVVTGAAETTLQLSQPASPGALVIGPSGDVLGAAIGLRESPLKTSTEIRDLLIRHQIPNQESPLTRIYREGLEQYFSGDYGAARQNFDQFLSSFPYSSDALLYREKAQELWETSRSPIEQFQAHPWRDRILLAGGVLLGIFILRRLFR